MKSEREREILEKYLTGTKILEITKSFKVSSATVSKILKKYDVQSRYKNNVDSNKAIYNEVVLLEFDYESIAKQHNLTVAEVKKIYRTERNKHLIKDYQSNMTIEALCIKYHLSNMAVYKILNTHNIPRKVKREKPIQKNNNISDEIQKEILKDYTEAKITVSQLLTKYNISKHQLYNILYLNGIETRNKTVLSDEVKFNIINDFKINKMTRTELARKYNVSRNLIGYIVKGETTCQ